MSVTLVTATQPTTAWTPFPRCLEITKEEIKKVKGWRSESKANLEPNTLALIEKVERVAKEISTYVAPGQTCTFRLLDLSDSAKADLVITLVASPYYFKVAPLDFRLLGSEISVTDISLELRRRSKL